jgi:Zn-dependent peptidase ImmA (M78 family)
MVTKLCFNLGRETIMINNYITRKRQSEIDSLLDDIQLVTGKSYPADDLLDIISAYIPDVSILEHDFGGDRAIRGAIYKKSDEFKKPLIVVQKLLSPSAKTFTIAHEFGHYSLDHPGEANYMLDRIEFDGTEEKQREADAQYFAASLLMPRDKFVKLMNYLSDSELALRFGVTEAAVRVRKAWLDGSGRDD